MADDPKPPSELFERVIINAGSLVIDCELCGRTHFATMESGIYGEGELEELLEKAKNNPEKYIQDPSYDMISWGTIDGKQAVIGCPCNGLRKYEDFIWHNRTVILEYLERRTAETLKRAKRDVENVERAKKANNE